MLQGTEVQNSFSQKINFFPQANEQFMGRSGFKFAQECSKSTWSHILFIIMHILPIQWPLAIPVL